MVRVMLLAGETWASIRDELGVGLSTIQRVAREIRDERRDLEDMR